MSDCAAFRADVARSVRLLRAFRTEQAAPAAYYAGLARDTARQLGQYQDLAGRVVADVGGGPGYFAREFRAAGAYAVCLDTNRGELAVLGHHPAVQVRVLADLAHCVAGQAGVVRGRGGLLGAERPEQPHRPGHVGAEGGVLAHRAPVTGQRSSSRVASSS